MKKRTIVLSLDTSKSDIISVGLEIDGKRIEKYTRAKKALAQMVLPLVEELLHEHNITIADISDIRVSTGPGSFTGLRVGMAVANMLGALLGVPVNGQAIGTIAVPHYSPSKLDS